MINADVADMDDPDLDAAEIPRRLRTLVDLARAIDSPTIMLACGRQGTQPRTELSRDIAAVARTLTWAAEFVSAAGLELLVEAPHSRRLCADLDRSEMLETHDIDDADRAAEAGRAGRYITSLLRASHPGDAGADSRT